MTAGASDGNGLDAWADERGRLLNMLAQQQRLAQAGLLTAGLAHEISNHVMVITGLAFSAQRSVDPKRWRNTLAKIQERCDDLSQTLSTILAFAGRREQDGRRGAFSAGAVVAQATRLLRPLAIEQGVGLVHTVTADAELHGDERLAVQALVNVGSNAIRACAGRPGRIELDVATLPGGTCRIQVKDDGPGIPEHLRPGVFRPFVTSQTDTGGHGLGLFIVRRAVGQLGGRIRLETSSTGTSICLDLPIPSVPASAPPRGAGTLVEAIADDPPSLSVSPAWVGARID
jgi:signal transduction histidine kinase